MYQVISIGAALVDIFVHSPQFQTTKVDGNVMLCQLYGDKVELDSFQIHTGGGASNTAVGLARLGFTTAVLAELGKDTLAKMVTENLEQEEVSTEFLIRERQEQTGGSVILVGNDGGRTVMVHRGAASQLDVKDLPREKLVTAEWWHLSNIAGRLTVLQTLFTLARLHKIGLSWNPGKAELLLLKQGQLHPAEVPCTLLFVNKEEWAVLEPVQSQLKEVIPQIIITDGARGGEILVKQAQPLKFKAATVTSKDDTGAGDAFAAAYVAAYLHLKHPVAAAAWGVANAASVVQQVGAKTGLLTSAQLEILVKDVNRTQASKNFKFEPTDTLFTKRVNL